jgi:hypothetical protein
MIARPSLAPTVSRRSTITSTRLAATSSSAVDAPAPLRRLAAAALVAALGLSPAAALPPPQALAATSSIEQQLDADLLPAAPSPPTTVPRGYRNTVEGLITSVRDALDADDRGAPERDVRRRADPARERVREFVGKWRDSPVVSGTVYHEEVKAAIAELGAFYSKAGPRAAVTRDVRASVLAHLERAEAALPPAEKGMLGF